MVKPARAAGELMGEQRNQTAYWLELLVDGNMMPAEKLSPLRQEWSDRDERHARQRRAGSGE